METPEGYDEVVWKQMAEELALQGIHVPEEYGGQGFSFVELGIVLGGKGRALFPSPYFSSVCLAANALLNAGSQDDKGEVLPRVAGGERIATPSLAAPELENVRARAVGEPGATWPALARTLDQVAVCLSAEMVGGADRCLEMAVQYAKERVQFGRPIGMFQAVKHRCANMLLQVESARTAAYYALWVAAGDDAELPVVAPMAKAFCSEAYFKVACDNHQVHGGIGFPWEHDAHLYFRRPKAPELLVAH